VGDYRSLKAWQKAHRLVVSVYKVTESFPSTESYGLVIQMRRAAVSTASNIAEGIGRNRPAETAHMIRVALGSCTELEAQVLLSQELRFVTTEVASQLSDRTSELRAMLASLHRRLLQESRPPNG
jgi:four helix bundle protein